MRAAPAGAILALLLACFSCTPTDAPDPVDEPPLPVPVDEPLLPDPELLWRACREDPTRFEDCRRHVVAARRDPDLLPRLEELAAAHPEMWIPQHLLGLCHYARARYVESERHYRRAALLARAEDNAYGEGASLYAMAAMLIRAGEAERAAALLEEALNLARRAGDRTLLVRVLQRIAKTCRNEGRFYDERAIRQELLDLADDGENTEVYRKALYRLAETSRRLGKHERAVRDFEHVLELSRKRSDGYYEAASAMALGVLALDLQEGRALELFESASRAANAHGREDLEAHAAMLAGVALTRAGRYAAARDRLRSVLDGAVPLDDRLRFRTIVFLADAERLHGDHAAALALHEEIEELAPVAGLPDEHCDSLMGLAALQRKLGNPDAAIEAARRAEELVESMRASIAVFAERTHFLQTRSGTYQVLASSLAERNPSDLAAPFDAVERAHARTLREVLAGGTAASPAIERLSLQAVRARLEPGELLVEYLLGEEESLLLAVDTDKATFHGLPARRQIEDRVDAYREALLRPLTRIDARLDPERDFRRFSASGQGLFQLLLGPVAERVRAAERLVVVPDRRLYLLPFEALLTKPAEEDRALAFLGASHAIEYLPAAAFLEPPAASPVRRVVVVSAGAGRTELDLAPLRHAETEGREVGAAYGPGRAVVLRNDEASLERIAEECAGPLDVLHLTAHAIPDPAEGPRIVLGGTDPGPSWLDAGALERLPAAPRRVILSACETARGELVGGEGILGLVRAFTLAGSRQVVASLWVVDDRRTAALMGRMHGALDESGRTSDALRTARRSMLDEGFLHPFYWAGFVLYGSD